MTSDEAILLVSEIHSRGSISTLEADALRGAIRADRAVKARPVSEKASLVLTTSESFGQRVREAREALDWSQSKLSRAVGITQPALRKIEIGETRQTKFAIPIAQALGIPRESIVSFCEVPNVVS